jgi:hypothetical protein
VVEAALDMHQEQMEQGGLVAVALVVTAVQRRVLVLQTEVEEEVAVVGVTVRGPLEDLGVLALL